MFTSERGAPFSTAGFARMVERAGREAKFAFKAHPHMLRRMWCAGESTGMGLTVAALTAAGCGNNFSVWNIGARTQFNLDSQTYLGVDIVYQQLNTALSGITGGAW